MVIVVNFLWQGFMAREVESFQQGGESNFNLIELAILKIF